MCQDFHILYIDFLGNFDKIFQSSVYSSHGRIPNQKEPYYDSSQNCKRGMKIMYTIFRNLFPPLKVVTLFNGVVILFFADECLSAKTNSIQSFIFAKLLFFRMVTRLLIVILIAYQDTIWSCRKLFYVKLLHSNYFDCNIIINYLYPESHFHKFHYVVFFTHDTKSSSVMLSFPQPLSI